MGGGGDPPQQGAGQKLLVRSETIVDMQTVPLLAFKFDWISLSLVLNTYNRGRGPLGYLYPKCIPWSPRIPIGY